MPVYPCGGPGDRGAGCGGEMTERERTRKHNRGYCFDCRPPYDEDRRCPDCGRIMSVREYMEQRICNDCEARR